MSRLEDDAVSLNSTAPSEGLDEYVIDGGILAERIVDEETQYLVKWEGYPEYRNTWEPEENFQSEDTLKEWRHKQMRITRGLDKPFDVEAFEERQDRILEEIALRKRNRRLKRKRLGIPVDTSSSSSADGSSSDEPLLQISKQPDPTARIEVSQKGQIETTKEQNIQPKVWTGQERRALEAGMEKVGGPQWNAILIRYGPNGTENRDLKRMNEKDLQTMASNMSKEFLAAGQSPPSWLGQAATHRSKDKSQPNNTAPYLRESPDKVHSLRGGDSREKPHSASGDLSRRHTPVRLQIPSQGRAKNHNAEPTVPQRSSNSERFNFSALSQQLPAKAGSQAGTVKRHPAAAGNRPTPQDQTSAAKSGVPAQGQNPKHSGAYGVGPARPKSLGAKSDSRRPSLITQKTKKHRAHGPKLFQHMAIQNRVFKRGRQEPTPNIDSLALIDPSNGKVPDNLALIDPSNGKVPDNLASIDSRNGKVPDNLASINPRNGKVPNTLPSRREKSSINTTGNTKSSHGREPESAHGDTRYDEEPFQAEATIAKTAVSNNPIAPDLMVGMEHVSTQNPQNISSTRNSMISSEIHSPRRPSGDFTVDGQLKVGFYDPKSYPVRLHVLDRVLQQLLLTIKSLHRDASFEIKETCLAAEYEKFYPLEEDELFGSGYIISDSASGDHVAELATQLTNDLLGAFCFTEFYYMLIYPVGNDAWAFLDRTLPATPEGALLRFIVREPLDQAHLEGESRDEAIYWTQNPERHHQIMANSTDNSVTKGINVVFRETYGIEYLHLVSEKRPNFFLCFIPAGCESYEKDLARRHTLRLKTSEEHDLTVKFLHENGAKVFSLQELGSYRPSMDGSWDYFVSRTRSGVILIHDACKRIDQIPKLVESLQNATNVWRISLEPMDEGARHPHLIRLFPHGAVILLTHSLILYRPYEALRILLWFRLVILSGNQQKTPGTWKLAIRPHLRSWLLDILDLYEDMRKGVFGYGKQVLADIYTNITWLLEWEYLSNGMTTWGLLDDIPTDEAPLVAPASLRAIHDPKEWNTKNRIVNIDHDKIRLNDDILVQWFAEWAVLACENFRRFHIVLGYRPGNDQYNRIAAHYGKTWGHIETFNPETFYKRHNVTPQAELDTQEAERLRDSRRRAPDLRARNAAVWKQDREAKRAALEKARRQYHAAGATEKQVRDRLRLHLRQTGATLKEIKEAKIDMDLQERWYEGLQSAGLGNDLERFEQIEAMLAEERAEEERLERQDPKRVSMGKDKARNWIAEGVFRGGGGDDDDGDNVRRENLDGEPMDTSL